MLMVEKHVVNGDKDEFARLQRELGLLPGPVPLPERPTGKILGIDVPLNTGIPPELVRKINDMSASVHEDRKLADAELSGNPELRQKALRYRELSRRMNPPKEG
jgi:hypothetical protein